MFQADIDMDTDLTAERKTNQTKLKFWVPLNERGFPKNSLKLSDLTESKAKDSIKRAGGAK